jgi:hypothetical protein
MREDYDQCQESNGKDAVIATHYSFPTIEIGTDKITVVYLSAKMPARLPVSKNGSTSQKTRITSEDRKMYSGFNAGEKTIPDTRNENPKSTPNRYKIP